MAGTTVRNFTPAAGNNTVSISATTASSANVALAGTPKTRKDVRVVNNGANTAFIKFGADSTVAATVANDMPIRAGADVLLHAGDNLYAAAISTVGNTTVYFTSGFGN